METGFFCEYVNSFLYQYYKGKHPCCILPVRILAMLLLSILGPIFGYAFAVLILPFYLTGLFFAGPRKPVAFKIVMAVFFSPIVYVIILTVIAVSGALMFVVLPFIYLWLIVRIVYM